MNELHLGEFEELILLTVAIMNGKAYGIAIIDELEKRTGRIATIGAIQTVLKRMESKGWVSSAFGEATKERGGKRKRYYSITFDGQAILSHSKDQRNSLWHAIPKIAWYNGTV